MRVHFPPVGIAHITNDIGDLLVDRLVDGKALQVACVMQPKTEPHFGTMVVVMTTFAIARHLYGRFGLPTDVLIDVLENSPADTTIVGGREYSTCLSHAVVDGQAAWKRYMEPVLSLANHLSTSTGLPFRQRLYREIQSQPRFREGLGEMLRRPGDFLAVVCPSDHRLRVRPMCGKCGIVEKQGDLTLIEPTDLSLRLISECPVCGPFEVLLSDGSSVIDTNTPIRTLLRTLCFIEQRNTEGIATVVINGSDWAGVWMQRVYFDGLCLFGYSGRTIPLNIFTPLITDDSGAKLSKTIYLEADAYCDLDPAWTSITAFRARFGDKGIERLWREVSGWVEEPRRLFRDYSLRYVQGIVGDI